MFSTKYNVRKQPQDFYDKMGKHGILHHAEGGVTISRMNDNDTKACRTAQGRSVKPCEVVAYLTVTAIISSVVGGIVSYATGNKGFGALAGFAVATVAGIIACLNAQRNTGISFDDQSIEAISNGQELIDIDVNKSNKNSLTSGSERGLCDNSERRLSVDSNDYDKKSQQQSLQQQQLRNDSSEEYYDSNSEDSDTTIIANRKHSPQGRESDKY
jgi:hypothetical protein